MGNDIYEYIKQIDTFINYDLIEKFENNPEISETNSNYFENNSYNFEPNSNENSNGSETNSTISEFSNNSLNIFKENCKLLSEIIIEIENTNVGIWYECNEYTHLIFTFFCYLYPKWDLLYNNELCYVKRLCMNYILDNYNFVKNELQKLNEQKSSNKVSNFNDNFYHNLNIIKNLMDKILTTEGVNILFVHYENVFIDTYEFEESNSIIIIKY